MKKTTVVVDAMWDESLGAYQTPQDWSSVDGDIWYDAGGELVDSPDFHGCSIRLVGGPRDGVVVG